MFSLKSIFSSSQSSLEVTRLLLPKGNLAALSQDTTLLACASPNGHQFHYVHLPSDVQKQISCDNITALTMRPNDKHYQQSAPAREIRRDEIVIASRHDNQIRRYLPSLGSFLKPLAVQEPTALACSPSGQLLAVGTAQGQLFVYDLAAQDPPLIFSTRIAAVPITQVLFGIDGEHIFVLDRSQTAYMVRPAMEYFEEAGNGMLAGSSVYPRVQVKAFTAKAKSVNAIASVLPLQVSHISVHPYIRQVSLISPDSSICFWNYACATVSYLDCPLEGPMVGYFCPDSDHFLANSRQGLAVYPLARRQRRVASATSPGGPFPVQYEVVLSSGDRPKMYPSDQSGRLIRALGERDGERVAICC